MRDGTVLKLAAICGIVFLDSLVIIVLHINHTLLVGSVATVAGIAGYGVGNIRGVQKCKEKIQKAIPEVAEKIREWDCRG